MGNQLIDVWQITRDEAALPDFVRELFETRKLSWQQNFFGAWTVSVGSNLGADSAIPGFWLILSADGTIRFVADNVFLKKYERLE